MRMMAGWVEAFRWMASPAARGGGGVRQASARRTGPGARGRQRRQLRRNMEGLDLVLVPEMYWDYCRTEVLVMERMNGCTDQPGRPPARGGVDIPKLARATGDHLLHPGVSRRFFHADMHPGNIQVSIARTFGRSHLAGLWHRGHALTETDKEYLAQNFPLFPARLQARR